MHFALATLLTHVAKAKYALAVVASAKGFMVAKVKVIQTNVDLETHRALRLYAAATDGSIRSVSAEALKYFVEKVVNPRKAASVAHEGSQL